VAARPNDPKSIPQVATELWELTVAYAKQETVDPLRGLGRYLGYGVGGSVVFGFGSVLLLMSLLRALQTETGTTFTGSLSWIPYLIVVAAAALLVGLLVWRVVKRKGSGL
jgi:Putative Actinobacterial Holin-X, holin superfamily III